MIAARKLYPGAKIVFPGSQEKKLREFIAAFHPIEICRLRDVDLSKITRLIIVDAHSPDRLGPFSELLREPRGPEIHIYDHHPLSDGEIHGTIEVIEDVGATATIFTEILRARKIHITPIEATILCLGIYEETGSFLFPSTTERDLIAVTYLLKRGASLNIVSNFISAELSKEEFTLIHELIHSSSDMEVNGIRVKVVKASREDFVGDAAHLAHWIMYMEDIDGLILLLGMEGKILLIGRSRVPEFNVGELMKTMGGGGHPSAASATVKGASLEVVEDEVKSLIGSSIRFGRNASDIMVTPVITVIWDDSIRQAESMMTRYGVNVLPVVKDGTYKGIISREVVEKAIFHGFGKSRVKDFTTTDALTVGPEAQIRDIERLMIEQNQRFMPVVVGGAIVGAITRTDILRTLYEDMLKRSGVKVNSAEEKLSIGRNLVTWLKERFPPSVKECLHFAGEVAELLGCNAYLVGGSVRDLLRGQENLDIDIVIEGDGIRFANEFGRILNAKVRTHERFGTAQVFTHNLKIDVATARMEYYESPAALPKVEVSSIKKDLSRRDFTINTLAVKLTKKDFGMLIDYFGGQRDLKEKTIRVLHNLSFIEDPTRAFRAVRFSERFGFKISKHTQNLMKSALRMNLFDKLSGSRLYEELRMTFDETEPVRAIKRLSEYGLLKVIQKNLVFDGEMESRLQSLHDTLSWFNLLFLDERLDKSTLYLMTLLSSLSDEDRDMVLCRLSTPPKINERITKGIMMAKELLRMLPLQDPARIYKVMHVIDAETLLFAMALTPDTHKKKEISQYLLELRKIKPHLTGTDLKNMGIIPGPIYSRIFATLLEGRLSGNLRTKEDEIAAVRGLQLPTEQG